MKRALLWLSLICLNFCCFATEPNPPPCWDNTPSCWNTAVSNSGVLVFDPSDDSSGDIQPIVDQIFTNNGGSPDLGQWSDLRYALLFRPGTYENTNVNVGYYTSIIGLGTSPDDTTIGTSNGGGVICEEGNLEDYTIGALNTFWRSAENFRTEPSGNQGWEWTTGIEGFIWAVSQAAPLRRVHVAGTNPNLYLYEYVKDSGDPAAGFASGGFAADCQIEGITDSGSQQQWLARNVSTDSWPNGAWNIDFLGSTGTPASNCGTGPFLNVAATPIIAEKPYISYDSGKFYLQIPPVETNKIGTTFDQNPPFVTTTVDFENVYVATASDSAATINAKLAAELHVILSPGIYNLDDPITVNNANTVVLGIGFPTLISTTGKPCIIVGSASGIRIGGILLQAGETTTSTLLQWGSPGDNPENGFLYDCFARVGGTNNPTIQPQLKTTSMVTINSNNIVCDNLWLWRADHYGVPGNTGGGLVKNGDNPCQNACIINGNNVTAYALAVEHTLQDICVWNGDDGSTYFFQCEYPYDVNESYATNNYVAYRVDTSVQNHTAYGVGVYSFFRDFDVTVNTAISTPTGSGIQFFSSLTVFLNGNGGINHVINQLGSPVNISTIGVPNYYCNPPPPVSAYGGSKVRLRRF